MHQIYVCEEVFDTIRTTQDVLRDGVDQWTEVSVDKQLSSDALWKYGQEFGNPESF